MNEWVKIKCLYGDPHCPCQDNDPCHYEDHGNTKAICVPPAYVRNLWMKHHLFVESLVESLVAVKDIDLVLTSLKIGEPVRDKTLRTGTEISQFLIAVEESAEFIQAAMKQINRTEKGDLVGEIADSLITLMSVAKIVGFKAVSSAINNKTERQRIRL